MFGIGFFELVVVGIVAVLALKPEQLASTIKTIRGSVLKVRQYTSKLENDLLVEQQQDELATRIQAASKVSDLSDLISETQDEPRKQA